MRKYTDLTVEVLAALTDQAIQRFIDIEVAEAGVQMVPKPIPYEPVIFDLEPTQTAYKVKGVIVGDIATAEILLKAKVYRADYNYPDYEHKYLREEMGGIEIQTFYDHAALDAVKDRVAESARNKEVYDKANKAFCDYENEIAVFRSEVLDAVTAARQVIFDRQQAQTAYEKYLDLAEGDTKIAGRFFQNAYRSNQDMIEFVLGDELPQEVT